jgi:methionyl-tRNA formyltransferase
MSIPSRLDLDLDSSEAAEPPISVQESRCNCGISPQVPEPRKLAVMLAAEYAGGVSALNLLSSSPDCEVVTVLTSYDRPAGKQLAAMCAKRNITVVHGELVKDPAYATDLLMYGVDIGLSVQCPYTACRQVLEAAKIGWFNLHGGPLPGYAGASPTKALLPEAKKNMV